MRHHEIALWRNLLGLRQDDVAKMLGRERRWVHRVEHGDAFIPRWLQYTVAWTLVHGPELPYAIEEIPAIITDTMKRHHLSRSELANYLGISSEMVREALKGRPRPKAIAYALAYIRLHGPALPEPGAVKWF